MTTIPHKVFLPAVGALLTLSLGITLILSELPSWLTVLITIAATGVTVLISEQLVLSAWCLADLTVDGKGIAVRLVALAVVSDGSLAVFLEVAGLSALPLALLGQLALAVSQVLVAVVADAYLFRMRPRLRRVAWERQQHAARQRQQQVEVRKGRERADALVRADPATVTTTESHDVRIMREALKRVKLDWVEIRGEPTRLSDDRGLFGIRFEVQITSTAMLNKNQRTLSVDSAEPIAVALSELLNQRLHRKWVAIQRLEHAGGYTITVTTQDVMKRVYQFQDTLEWGDIEVPARVGFGLDARPIYLKLRQHGQFLGKTRAGKSSLINCTIAYGTRCRNVVYWICGVKKLYDILAGWLEIYLDTEFDMPFDWVMAGPADTAEMLAALERVSRYRQSLRNHERQNLPDIILVLDEASYALRDTSVTGEVDGLDLTMSALCGMITQGAGSANCWLHYATQRDTNDQLGSVGGDIQAQVGFTAMFGTQDNLSLGRQLGDFKLPPPTHKGEYYLKNDDAEETYPVLVKSEYIQEDDPSKPVLHDGLKLSEVSWSRRNFKTRLDEGSQRAAGEVYLRRPTRVTERFIDYLRNPRGVSMPLSGLSYGAGTATEVDPDEAARDLARHQGLDFDDLPPAQREAYREVARELHEDVPAPSDEPSAPVSGNLTEQVTWVLRRAGRPLAMRDLLDAMRTAGLEVRSEGSVRNLLGKLVEDGVLTRGADRLYELPDGN